MDQRALANLQPTMTDRSLEKKASIAATVPDNCRIACAALSSDELAEWIRSRGEAQARRKQANRSVLAICPEFICYEEPDGNRTVEATPELERTMDIARFGISAAKGVDIRLAQARALLELAEFTAGHEKDRDALLEQMADAFGKPALEVLNTPPVTVPISPQRQEALARLRRDGDPPVAGHAHSAAEQRKKAECAAEDFVTAIRNALRCLINWKFPLPDKRSTQPDGIDLVWLAQFVAKDIFRLTLERPTQQLIQEVLREDGYGFSGHDADERWEELFKRAALSNLPQN